MGVLDGKVVLIPGGAKGMGKECSLLAAKEGAAVVVNDIGGDASEAGAAEQLVRQIRDAGGKAVSNFETVASRTGVVHMIEQALDEFGGLHAIINPVGTIHNGPFHEMSDADWDEVIELNLQGSYNLCRAAVNHFREQQEGSFVLFTATGGLIGNEGQANYAAAKMGTAGLSRVLAMEGATKNVRSNVIAPVVWTRMISSIQATDEASIARVERMKKMMRADQVVLLAVALASPATKDVSGQIFASRGNEIFLMSQSRAIRGIGRIEGWTPETIINHCIPALRSDFYDLSDTTSSVFDWDPI
jgi:NAD(P)-dependent dehydrogenase (short-subunit alcohol dehydrogenase family)